LELRKNVIVAVRPNEQWFLDNPDEPRENFNYSAVLHHNIELNLKKSLYEKNLRIIQSRI
jgi:hypothetical protein